MSMLLPPEPEDTGWELDGEITDPPRSLRSQVLELEAHQWFACQPETATRLPPGESGVSFHDCCPECLARVIKISAGTGWPPAGVVEVMRQRLLLHGPAPR